MPRFWDTNFKVYGVRKAWNQLNRERFNIARSTAARMMTQNGLRGTVRGKGVKITPSDFGPTPACPVIFAPASAAAHWTPPAGRLFFPFSWGYAAHSPHPRALKLLA